MDQCLSPMVADGLRRRGFDAVHAQELGLSLAEDELLFRLAGDQDRVIVTADTDFGDLLALRKAAKPSVILFRDDAPATAQDILVFLDANLHQLEAPLRNGAIVVVRAASIRVRMLPIY